MKISNAIKKLLVIFVLIPVYSRDKVSIRVDKPKEEKMNLMFGLIHPDVTLHEMAGRIKDDLDCPKQKKTGFIVSMREFESIPTKQVFKSLSKEGFGLVIFLSSEKNFIEWRIYDANRARMVVGKKTGITDSLLATADIIADKLWLNLTGQEGIFTTKIAYCQDQIQNGHYLKNLHLVTPFLNDSHLLVKGGKALAPRWNNDPDHPLLLYSEATPSNIRLMSVTMDGRRKIVSNFDGINMLPSFSRDGQKVVYCFTKEGKSQLFFFASGPKIRKGRMTQITTKGNNVSPALLENGDIIFCSDFESKNPQIYYYYASTKKMERLTKGGYCACPAYSEKRGKIAYCKMINGTTQLFVYDMKNKTEEQLSFDRAKKDECSWSPCGNYLVYAYENTIAKRIAIMNMITKEQIFLTDSGEYCSYPSWSPYYNSSIIV